MKLNLLPPLDSFNYRYGLGIAFAIVVCAIPSGGHLSPSYTIAFWLLKGFPASKVPRYILSQLIGAFIACGFVYLQYKQEFEATYTLLMEVAPQTIFTPQGVSFLSFFIIRSLSTPSTSSFSHYRINLLSTSFDYFRNKF